MTAWPRCTLKAVALELDLDARGVSLVFAGEISVQNFSAEIFKSLRFSVFFLSSLFVTVFSNFLEVPSTPFSYRAIRANAANGELIFPGSGSGVSCRKSLF